MFKRKSKSNDDDDDKTIEEENSGRTPRFEKEERRTSSSDDDKTIEEENSGRTPRFENEERRTSSSEASSSLKKELLSIVASSRKANTIETRAKKREILDKVLELEKEASAKLDLEGDIQGRWSLVYSTDDDENKAMFMLDDANDKFVKEILDSLYKFFFAFAAPLAGGGFSSSETAKRKERGGELFKSIRNEQIVDLTNESVENFVDLEILGRETRVVVRGEIKPLDKNQRKVQVTFTDWSFDNLVTLPLPRPTGGLENTYCDETMRISRGSRGGVFITTRIRGGGGQESGKKRSPS